MASWRRAVRIVLACMVTLGAFAPATHGQTMEEPDPKHAREFQRIQAVLNEVTIETGLLQSDMPLSQFLTALERQLPRDRKLRLRIDRDAFGDRADVVAATPVSLKPIPKKTSLRRALETVLARVKLDADYRVEADAVTITTTASALVTAVHEIGALVERPEVLLPHLPGGPAFDASVSLHKAEPGRRASLVVQAILSLSEPPPRDDETIHVVNGTRLVVRANAARHDQFAQLLHTLHRLVDVAVIVQAEVYEVDAKFHTRLKNAKQLSLDELERQFLEGVLLREDSLFRLLEKETPIVRAEAKKRDPGLEFPLLSRHQVVRCLPSPEQVNRGEKAGQAVLDGVALLAEYRVSADRRSVRVKLTEKATEIQGSRKLKVWRLDGAGARERQAEIPLLKESSHTAEHEVPDGGSLLVPLQYRPAAARKGDRWWVLSITPRIYIEEEERRLRQDAGKGVLP